MTTRLLSVDHRLSGLDIIARFGIVAPGLGPDLLEAVPALRRVLVLSTCNRLALLIDADSWADTDCSTVLHPDLRPADVSQSVTVSDLGEAIIAFLAECTGLPMNGFLLTHLAGAAARWEVLAIAVSPSPMVVGETQIVDQAHHAAEAAVAEGTLGPELVRTAERASVTARRVAHETELSGQGRNVMAVGVDQATGHLSLPEDCHTLIVGTDSYAGATVADLRARGLTGIAACSTSNRAEAFITGHGLCTAPTGASSEAMSRANLMVTRRDTDRPILIADVVAPVATERASPVEGAGRPLVVLDLALTRDVDKVAGALSDVVHLDLTRVYDVTPDAEARQVIAVRATVGAEAADFKRTLAGWVVGPLITVLCAQAGRVIAEEAVRLCLQPAHQFALVVPAVDRHAGTSVSGANNVDAAAGTCPHHHPAADPGFEAASEIDGKPMVPLVQAERALHHLAARLLHQPTIMARYAGQEGCEGAYCQVLELAQGLENTGENHD